MTKGATSPLVCPFPAVPLGKCEFTRQKDYKELQVPLLDSPLNTATQEHEALVAHILGSPAGLFRDSESLGNPLLSLVGPGGFDCTTWL